MRQRLRWKWPQSRFSVWRKEMVRGQVPDQGYSQPPCPKYGPMCFHIPKSYAQAGQDHPQRVGHGWEARDASQGRAPLAAQHQSRGASVGAARQVARHSRQHHPGAELDRLRPEIGEHPLVPGIHGRMYKKVKKKTLLKHDKYIQHTTLYIQQARAGHPE